MDNYPPGVTAKQIDGDSEDLEQMFDCDWCTEEDFDAMTPERQNEILESFRHRFEDVGGCEWN